MEIRKLTTTDLEKLYAFNQKIYPERKIPYKDYIDFWLSKSEDEIGLNLILVDESNDIHGQILSSSMSYFYKGEKHDSLWGFDFIVEESLRKDNWGVDFLIKRNSLFPVSFGTGVAPKALKIHLLLKYYQLGNILKFVGISNPLWLLSSIGRGIIPPSKYPIEVKVNNYRYQRISCDDFPDVSTPYNNDFWEPSRDKSYMRWRFSNRLHEYAIYKDVASNDFFVVRTVSFKHVTVLMLVDYRCDMATPDSLSRIIRAVKKITNRIHISVIVVGSSLGKVDEVLQKHHFYKTGNPWPIIGRMNVKECKNNIENRNFAFVTFADSDGETDIF